MGSKRLTKEQVLSRLKETHPNLEFPTAMEDFGTVADYTQVICPTHGESSKSFENLLYNKTGCASCSSIKVNSKYRKPLSSFRNSEKIFSTYEVLEPDKLYLGTDQIRLRCLKHGEFSIRLKDANRGQGCYQCGRESAGLKQRKSWEQFSSDIGLVHGDKYEIVSQEESVRAKDRVVMSCPKHGVWEASAANLVNNKTGCPRCATKISQPQVEVYALISPICPDAILEGSLEGLSPDIIIPSKNLVIEFNGLYWHSSAFKEKYDHRDRRRKFNQAGYRVITIWENEWPSRKTRAYLLSQVGFFESIYGRKCTVGYVCKSRARRFIEENHLMGVGLSCSFYIGLFYEGELVGCSSYRWREGGWDLELYRAAYKMGSRVLGGLSKMLKFVGKIKPGKPIVSFIDLDKFDGASYYKSGFQFDSEFVSMSYCKRNKIIPRQSLQKKYLKQLENYSEHKTEQEILKEVGVYAIYNSGTVKVVLNPTPHCQELPWSYL